MNNLLSSRLYDNRSFYKAFEKDLQHAQYSVIIGSPFITAKRMEEILPILRKLRQRGVRITVDTRDPQEHDAEYEYQAPLAVYEMQELGITVLYTVKHHRKLAIIDSETLWEGSLNILSQHDSCEIMRCTVSQQLANEMMCFIGLSVGFNDLGQFLEHVGIFVKLNENELSGYFSRTACKNSSA
jgi:phosphatidylserine/phosphatidylglycerophosphate/cardiolipin synthase-like enzyme